MNEDKYTRFHWKLPKELDKRFTELADEMTMSKSYLLRFLVEREYQLRCKEEEKADESR